MENMNQQGGFQEGQGGGTPPPAPPAPAAEEDFGAIFSRATSLWTSNIASLIVVSLVFLLVCWIRQWVWVAINHKGYPDLYQYTFHIPPGKDHFPNQKDNYSKPEP